VLRYALSSVSAVANTAGGYLVFGIEQSNETLSLAGVVDADKIQNDRSSLAECCG
jgi:ATP-dependent DNA helicase RecG